MLTETKLNQFCGTTQYYPYLLGLKLTDGVKYLADEAGAYWLLDIIASYQTDQKIKPTRTDQKICNLPFQIWELKLLPKNITNDRQPAVVTMKTDTNHPLLVQQEISHTDFPLDSIAVWLIDGVMLLPSEY